MLSLDIQLKPIEFTDRPIFDDFFSRYPQTIDHYTFASLMMWKHEYHHQWTVVDDTLLITTHDQLMQPIGPFPKQLQEKLRSYPGKIFRVSDEFISTHKEFCSRFKDSTSQDDANYLYLAEDLANLSGRKFDSKRNLISQGEAQYRYDVHQLTDKCKPHCPRIFLDIGTADSKELTGKMKYEFEALNFTLEHFSELNQKGYVISIEGKPAAFAIYERLNPDTAVVHFEKAERKYKGLYQLINRETSKAILNEGYTYINREEDLGVPGLRKAKESYRPIKLINAHILSPSDYTARG